MITKINFIKQIYQPKFSIIESIYYRQNFRNLNLHLERLQHTAEKLFFDINIDIISKALYTYASKLDANIEYKISLEYHYSGNVEISHIYINNFNIKSLRLVISPIKIDSKNQLFRYKTTHSSTRCFYTKMYNKYIGDQEGKELLFLNEFGNITETRFHNILIEKDGKKYTPLLSDGILDGIARKVMIAKEDLIPKSINLAELRSADKIYLINSVRGLIPTYLGD